MQGEARGPRHLGVSELGGRASDLDLDSRATLIVERVRVLGDQVLVAALP